MERRPRMLKDFLNENSNSCSSSGFKSFPRKPNNNNSMKRLIEMELKSCNSSSSSNSTFQTVMNTIRSFSFFTRVRKSPPSMLFLPRSLSRKLSSSSRISRKRRSHACKEGSEIKISTVKIKDIIRWKSFRDLAEEHHQHQPSLPPPPLPQLDFHNCTTGSTTTTTTSSTTCSSSDSSWSDSDFLTFTLEAQNDNVKAGKFFSFSPLVVGKDSAVPTAEYAAAAATKEVLSCEEDEQQSPVSVLQLGEDEFSPFDQSLANIERKKQKFIKTVQKFESLANLDQCLSLDENSGYDEEYEDDDDNDVQESEEQDWVEERAKQLLHCVKATSSAHSFKDYLDTLLLDFFREELRGSRNQNRNEEEFEREVLRIAEEWVNGSFEYDIGHLNNDVCIKDMDRSFGWNRFEEEQEELALEIETAILHSLVIDLLGINTQ
ncbi:uncharacterized protein LOC133292913 [Gastrolobium bilobum]|uniref:uncharacterized protein LOC133292913 n=1 Tax=Gastrolobium bilobum TaxID=150636 RepID=UPI002AB2BDB1|nr:uncharacterized protein LOC133292913 [Gastrolobium bilobum]